MLQHIKVLHVILMLMDRSPALIRPVQSIWHTTTVGPEWHHHPYHRRVLQTFPPPPGSQTCPHHPNTPPARPASPTRSVTQRALSGSIKNPRRHFRSRANQHSKSPPHLTSRVLIAAASALAARVLHRGVARPHRLKIQAFRRWSNHL